MHHLCNKLAPFEAFRMYRSTSRKCVRFVSRICLHLARVYIDITYKSLKVMYLTTRSLLQSPILNCPAGTDVHCCCMFEVLALNKGHVAMGPSSMSSYLVQVR